MKIAVIGSGFVRSDRLKEILAGYFPEATFSLAESKWPSEPFQNGDEVLEYSGDPEQVAELASDADLLVLDVAPVTQAVLRRARRLKAIGVCRGGPVNVNVEAATERGIPVLNSPGRNAAATAEFTVGLILAGMRRICLGDARMKEGIWDGGLYVFQECEFQKPIKVGKRTALIEFFATDPKYRRRGVAKAIMNHLLSLPQYDEYILEVTNTNPQIIGLYEKLGFREFERIKQKYSRLSGLDYMVYMRYTK